MSRRHGAQRHPSHRVATIGPRLPAGRSVAYLFVLAAAEPPSKGTARIRPAASRRRVQSSVWRFRIGSSHSTSCATDARRVFGVDKHRAAALGISNPRKDDGLLLQYLVNRSLATPLLRRLYDRLWPGRAKAALKFVAGKLTSAGMPRPSFRARREGPLMAGTVSSPRGPETARQIRGATQLWRRRSASWCGHVLTLPAIMRRPRL